MNVVFPAQHSLSPVGCGRAQHQGTNSSPLEASATRYIQRLEVEVGELTQLYEAACQLLYHAVFVQDASAVTLDECEARRLLVEAESSAYSDLSRHFFRLTTIRREAEAAMMPRGSEEAAALQNDTALRLCEVQNAVVSALRGALSEGNERLTRLLEAVPQRVSHALSVQDLPVAFLAAAPSSTSARKDLTQADEAPAASAVVQQRLETIVTRLDELVRSLNQALAPGAGAAWRDDPVQGHIASLRDAVRSLEESSKRIAEVLQRREGDAGSSQPPPATSAAAAASPSSSVDSHGLQDSSLLQNLAEKSAFTLASLFSEYMLANDQMQMMAEHELDLLLLVHDRGNMIRWNRCMEEKESEIRRLQSEVARLEKEARNSDATGAAGVSATASTTTREKRDAPETLAQLYARFAAPFVPPNVRTARTTRMQNISKLRKEARRVGARPASANPASDGAVAEIAASPVAVRKIAAAPNNAGAAVGGQTPQAVAGPPAGHKTGGASPPEGPVRYASGASSTPPAPRDVTRQRETKEEEHIAAPPGLGRAASRSPPNAAAAGGPARQQRAAAKTEVGVVENITNPTAVTGERGGGGALDLAIHRLRRSVSMSSHGTSASSDSATNSALTEGRAAHDDAGRAPELAVLANSFDASTDDPPKTRQSGLAVSSERAIPEKDGKNGDPVGLASPASLEARGKQAASASRYRSTHSVQSSSSSLSTSITLTLDTSRGSDEERRRAATKTKSTPRNERHSLDWDDAPPGAVDSKTRGKVVSEKPGIRAKALVSGLKSLSFTNHR
ncbi:uncharacterized protein Tco025E_01218 [Trypanosoma conorhini]|uniref:Uncharacterized protein n=1 Tax=Trypanosoma conorhini TaxID=83891 RepID=A0A422Q965_9TRYP|nr:uncharacterized protein Tco025E_01218 [Trypanosoma conorhini]RNF26513.1 hypothetical protein Tco025E_01218 [Trypanosoma conorhini]